MVGLLGIPMVHFVSVMIMVGSSALGGEWLGFQIVYLLKRIEGGSIVLLHDVWLGKFVQVLHLPRYMFHL